MRQMTKAVTGLLGLMILTITVSQTSISAQSGLKAETSVEGVWKTTVTPRNCATGDQVMPEFEGLLTFNIGGTLAETSSGSAPGTRGPGHGVWKRLPGWQIFSMRFLFQRFSPGGLIGTTVVRQEVQLDGSGDSFSSTGTVEIVANDGSTLATLCTTSTGTRFD